MSNPIPPPGAPPMMQSEPQKQGRGCLFWGCTISLITFLVIVIALVIGGYMVYNKVLGYILPYTSETAATLPKVEGSPDQYTAIKKRVDEFVKAVEEDKSAELSLSADEINILINEDPRWKELKGKVFVKIEGEEIKADVSIPLDFVPLPALKKRYVNGTAGVKVSLKGGVLLVTPETIVVKDKPIPEQHMKELRKINLAQDVYKDKEQLDFINKFKSIEVKDGKITITK